MREMMTLCDFPLGSGNPCKRVAVIHCPLCERDICADHHQQAHLTLQLRLQYPENGEQTLSAHVIKLCVDCRAYLRGFRYNTGVGMFGTETMVAGRADRAREAARAVLARNLAAIFGEFQTDYAADALKQAKDPNA